MLIEEFGARVASVWQGLRPATRSLLERALTAAQSASNASSSARTDAAYDARSEWELSRLLAALDERAAERGAESLNAEQVRSLVRMAETCVTVLNREARSAEVFAQLLQRALRSRDYARVDLLADAMSGRLASSELCELARHPMPTIRAIAHEALLQLPTSSLVALLGDPVDIGIARIALEGQADEYDSEEARWIISALEQVEEACDDDDL